MASVNAQVTENTTDWVAVASDGSVHANLSVLAAAGKVPYPGLPPGGLLASLMVRTITSGNADGDVVNVAVNEPSAPAFGHPISGSGQTVSLPCFAPPQYLLQVHNVWIKKKTGTDYVVLSGMH